MALEFTDANFKELVLESDKPVLVDFWATWCGPCRAIAPVIDELFKELDGKAVIGKVNIDENSFVGNISKGYGEILSLNINFSSEFKVGGFSIINGKNVKTTTFKVID